MNQNKSNSVGNIEGLLSWFHENFIFFQMRLNELKRKEVELFQLVGELDDYAKKYNSLTKQNLKNAKILEIGFGARPNRLISLISLGYDAQGIDLDRPILKGNMSEFLETYKKNGIKRTFKSFIRNKLFDKHERSALQNILSKRQAKLNIDSSRFLIGDAASFEFPPESIDFIYSEDVFEHIPIESLHKLCENLNASMTSDGVALISPVIFTGIAGGHLVEWYPHTLHTAKNRKSEPWEHLRKRRFVADCYLNELRVNEFKEIFQHYFEIVDILNVHFGMGKEYLSPMIREELSEFEEDELLSHKWTFILRKKSS